MLMVSNYSLSTLKEVYTLMPQSPRAMTLYASVLSHYPDTRKKALALFQEVFGIEPHCIDAVLALSQLYVWEHQNQVMLALTLRCVSSHSDYVNAESNRAS